jgi:hypothetical protein
MMAMEMPVTIDSLISARMSKADTVVARRLPDGTLVSSTAERIDAAVPAGPHGLGSTPHHDGR